MAENFSGLTDTGRQRSNNEDAFIAETVLGDRFIAACVIDGVGGYEGGEVAADIAKTSILTSLKPATDLQQMMREVLLVANKNIVEEKKNSADNNRMACVLTWVMVEKGANKFYWAHVGDTRLYLFRDGSLVKISKDHSFVGFLEDSGRLGEEEAMLHPKRNEINKALGFEAPLPNAAEYIETGESPFLSNDLLLLCSDGLTDMIDKAKIISILGGNKTLDQKTAELIAAANAAGGKDNITVVLVKNDRKPLENKPNRPTVIKKKQEETRVVENNLKEVRTQPPVQRRSNHVLLYFFIILALLSLAGFLWQWLKKPKVADELNPGILPITAVSPQQHLQDSLNNGANQIHFTSALYGDTIVLKNALTISADSVHFTGNGSTVFTGDSAARNFSVIQVLPSVRYFLLDSLVLQNMLIRVSPSNLNAVQFKNVRFKNSGMELVNERSFHDSIFSGTLDQPGLFKDSLLQ
jgi:PPM family protein phosphatase